MVIKIPIKYPDFIPGLMGLVADSVGYAGRFSGVQTGIICSREGIVSKRKITKICGYFQLAAGINQHH